MFKTQYIMVPACPIAAMDIKLLNTQHSRGQHRSSNAATQQSGHWACHTPQLTPQPASLVCFRCPSLEPLSTHKLQCDKHQALLTHPAKPCPGHPPRSVARAKLEPSWPGALPPAAPPMVAAFFRGGDLMAASSLAAPAAWACSRTAAGAGVRHGVQAVMICCCGGCAQPCTQQQACTKPCGA
jgi:hypothetical protein